MIARLTVVFLAASTLMATSTATSPPAHAATLPQTWQAQTDPALLHTCGVAVTGGWQATIAGTSGPCFMVYGPSTSGYSGAIKWSASLKIDQVDIDSKEVALVQVLETVGTDSRVLTTVDVWRGSFSAANTFRDFSGSIVARPDASYQVRVYYQRVSTVTVGNVTVAADTQPGFVRSYDAIAANHATGHNGVDGWQATPGVDTPNTYMTYGPYATDLNNTLRAVFRLQSTFNDTDPDAWLGQIEAVVGSSVQSYRAVFRKDFLRSGSYQDFALNFVSTPGQQVQFRLYWTGNGYLKHQSTSVYNGTHWQSWESNATGMTHAVGRQITEPVGVAWQADPALDNDGYLLKGPGSPDLYGEAYAVYQVAVDNNTTNAGTKVARLSLRDSNDYEFYGRDIKVGDFKNANLYQDFRLRYTAGIGANLSFGVYFYKAAGVKLKVARVRAEDRPAIGQKRLTDVWSHTARFVVNPDNNPIGRPNNSVTVVSVVPDGTLYYAYYACTADTEECLAISSDDGKTFVPYDGGNPIMHVGVQGDPDWKNATFGSVVKVDDTWTMVYEAHPDVPALDHPATAWATSTDGVTWTKHGIAVPEGSTGQWDDNAAGTPSINFYNGWYYVWYHGCLFATVTHCSRGVAAGPSMSSLAKSASNPVLVGGGTGTWDSVSVGKASVLFDGTAYFMTYEGSNDPACSTTAQWGVGLARSTDLVTWAKLTGTSGQQKNPIRYMDVAGAGCQYTADALGVLAGRYQNYWLNGDGMQKDGIE